MHLQRGVTKEVADWRKLWLACRCVQQMNLLAWSMADDSSSSDRSQDETRAQVRQSDRSFIPSAVESLGSSVVI